MAAGLLALGVSSCSSGSSGGGSTFNLESLSGAVRSAGGTGLPGVTVTVGTIMAITDANGVFIIPSVGSVPSGQVTVAFDGSTATVPGQFPELDVVVDLPNGMPHVSMPQVITLPDLLNVNSANQSVTLNPDGSTTAAISVTGAQADLSLSAPTGTIITIDGAVGGVGVDLNMTPVPPTEVPMPLPDGLIGSSFVTIQPGNAAFDVPGAATGLDVTFANDQNFPIGTIVDIWSFDHDAGAWVNRTLETGQTGIVIDLGGGLTEIQASGVITEGGWHSPVITVDTNCATTVMGHVTDLATGEGIFGASVGLSTGQFATTGTDGAFTINSVPAYDVAANAADPQNCTLQNFTYEVVLPPSYGSTSSTSTFDALDIIPGGISTMIDVTFTIGTTGSLTGIVNGDGATPGEQVIIMPPTGPQIFVDPNADGSFFLFGLDVGAYTASFQFSGQAIPFETNFDIVANGITTINLQFVPGSGAEDITVMVLMDDDNEFTPMVPANGAQVTLQGTDPGSQAGLVMTTNASGMTTFNNVTGPYTITAQKDMLDQGDTIRFATSLIDINPSGTTVGMFIPVEIQSTPTLDATLSGTVSNIPVLGGTESMEIYVEATDFMGDLFASQATVNPGDGSYSLGIPSGMDFDMTLVHTDFSAESQVIATMLAPAVTGTTPGGTVTQDFDFASPSVIDWDQPVNVTFTNVAVGTTNTVVDADVLDYANGNLFPFILHFGPPGSVTLNLPDLTDPNLAGMSFNIFAENINGSGSAFQECDFALASTPASLPFVFMPLPTPIIPFDGSSYSQAAFDGLSVSFTEGATLAGGNGVNIFEIESGNGVGTPPVGIDGACWFILAPAGTESFDLPPFGLPMFGADEELSCEVDKDRFILPSAFNFNTFFDANVEANITSLETDFTSECESGVEFTVTLTP